MGWESRARGGKYYYRSRRIDGRRTKEYIGRGPAAEKAAVADRLDRLARQAARRAWEAEQERVAPAVGLASECDAASALVARAVLLVAGYYRDHGKWRLRRGRPVSLRCG